MPLDESPTPAQTAKPWPEIDRSLLEETRPPPPPFPVDLLPARWRVWAEQSAQAFTPVDYVAQSLFGAVSAMCGGAVVVQVTPQWAEPLLLWQALVGGPSSGKSPGLASARRLIDDDRDRSVPAVVTEESLNLVARKLIGSPRGVTLWCDGLADWMAAAGQGRDRTGWLAGWNGGRTAVQAPGWLPMEVERFALSVIGTLQPERLADSFGEGEDGLAARFLYAWPDAMSCAALGNKAAGDEGMRTMLQRIARLPGTAADPGVLFLEPDAVARLEQILLVLRQRMCDADGAEAGWIGKGAGTIVRLAGLLTMMHWAEASADAAADTVPDDVTAQRLEEAHALWADYFHPHARSVFQRAGAGDRDRTARRVARWLRRGQFDQVSREDIRRDALCQTVNAEGAEQVIARLEAGGVLRPLAADQSFGRPKRRWEVNPTFRTSR